MGRKLILTRLNPERELSRADQRTFEDIQALLGKAGQLADRLGPDVSVVMELWDAEETGNTVRGRLQYGCSGASICSSRIAP
ncbi:hypothetical protein HOU03_gp242 [Caulobacter phage CcrSC]|uniref:Uncharacterized protein n=1 Tax=Caulobacter phage CcrSC TaxID=2283272 RepID=A0A385EEE0_9CAUD|nr:hypothetical protein HOU03_gp242 [Caulobacter phage CcrSC]AXQ70026.1 hypothetical protein CcrSC_gp444 [Caulobacter phage CcrSC]